MLNCEEATRLMSQEQDRRLNGAERVALRLHLWICRGCTNYRAQMAVLRAACRRLAGLDEKREGQ